MKRIKQICALLIAVVLSMMAAMQSGVGIVFAENPEQVTGQITTITDSIAVLNGEGEPVTEAVTEPVTEPVTEGTEPAVTTDISDTSAITDIPDASDMPAGDENGNPPALTVFDRIMSCGTLAEIEALLFNDENAAEISALAPEEIAFISSRIEEIYSGIIMPTEGDNILKETLITRLNTLTAKEEVCPECGGLNGEHFEGCSLFAAGDLPTPDTPICSCGSIDGIHAEECPLYTADEILCTCGSVDGVHFAGCPLYVQSYIWSGLTDTELAAWLMDEANAETVKAIYADETTEEYALLTLRIDGILSGEDLLLAEQLMAYLAALVETDGAETLADPVQYIYFDLAAGDVTIGAVDTEGKKTYSGSIFVNGEIKPVSGDHKTENKYYIFQSNLTDETSPGYFKNTGYIDNTAYTNKTGCIVPTYPRVSHDGKPWTEYITNNINVEAVIKNWETAAAAVGRTALGEQKPGDFEWIQNGDSNIKINITSTGNRITFIASENYTADVTIDNIWTYYQPFGEDRDAGGITAHFKGKRNMKIYLRLKGDNRFGNIHYGANEGTQNRIFFINGEEGQAEGSITVADFPEDLDKNHWGSAIGGDDNKCDSADGIVIESGVIYAGTTYSDNCTAIGGGGNNFGGVTIKKGIVTAVAATTGTAIGGGIGWNGGGGNAKVEISGGTIYAYNLGIQTGARDKYDYFVPAVAIGGGSSMNSAGNARTIVNISDGTVYAQSTGGAAIGGGGSTKVTGGNAEINITGGNIIAKSTTGKYKGTKNDAEVDIPAGVSIGGGTGALSGGTVTLNISGDNTILRTGSIGGGKATNTGAPIGSATVNINGGDITGQVIMAAGASSNCSFTMTDGRIHGTDVINGNKIINDIIKDPQPETPILYLEKNGGAVWMEDEKGITTITGGIIEGCTAELGGAIYMAGGTFNLSGSGDISGNTASANPPAAEAPAALEPDTTAKGLGGAVYISNGTVKISGGTMGNNGRPNKAVDGAGVYVNGGTVNVTGGNVQYNEASENGGGIYVTKNEETKGVVQVSGGSINHNKAKNGGGVYLPDGHFTMTCDGHHEHTDHGGRINDNSASENGGGIFLTSDPTLSEGAIYNNTAGNSGGGVCVSSVEGGVAGSLLLDSDQMRIFGNNAKNGGGVAVLGGNFTLKGGAVGMVAATPAPISEENLRSADEFGTNNLLSPEPTEEDRPPASPDVPIPGDGPIGENDQSLTDGVDQYANVAELGGGIYVSGGKADVESGHVENNKATNEGGGLYVTGGEVNVAGGYIRNNYAEN